MQKITKMSALAAVSCYLAQAKSVPTYVPDGCCYFFTEFYYESGGWAFC